MNKTLLTLLAITSFALTKAQNVGIGEINPTHTLHVTPFNTGDDPIRVSGLNLSDINTDSSFVMFNNGDGVFKYMPFNDVLNTLIDSITSSSTFTDIIDNSITQAETPSGAIFAFPTSTPPTGYLACNGQAISRTTYADLFALLNTTYGNGDGTTTFNLPNYNGQFLRGWDNGEGVDLDATIRTDRGDGTTGDAVGTKQANQTLAHNHSVDPPATSSNSTGDHLHTIDPPTTTSNTTGNHTHSVDPPNTTTTTNGNHTHQQKYTGGTSSSCCGLAGTHSSYRGERLGTFTAASGNHNHTVNIAAFNSATSGNHSHTVDIAQFNSNTTGNHSHTTDIAQFNSNTTGNHVHSTDISSFNSGNNGGTETRPTNISVLWCIKF